MLPRWYAGQAPIIANTWFDSDNCGYVSLTGGHHQQRTLRILARSNLAATEIHDEKFTNRSESSAPSGVGPVHPQPNRPTADQP